MIRVVQECATGVQRAKVPHMCLIATFFNLSIWLAGCVRISPILDRSGAIYIEEPIMAKGADDQGNPKEPTSIFTTADKRIYCTVAIRGPDHVKLGARWYYGDKLIGTEQWIDLGTIHRGVWWLEMAPGRTFPPGNYRIEIFLVQAADKTVPFKVVDKEP